MILTNEFNGALDDDVKTLNKEVVKFFRALQDRSPVDTGEFRDAWIMERSSLLHWRFYNPQEYGGILWAGWKKINGKEYGSKQGWGLHGGDVDVDKFEKGLDDLL